MIVGIAEVVGSHANRAKCVKAESVRYLVLLDKMCAEAIVPIYKRIAFIVVNVTQSAESTKFVKKESASLPVQADKRIVEEFA